MIDLVISLVAFVVAVVSYHSGGDWEIIAYISIYMLLVPLHWRQK